MRILIAAVLAAGIAGAAWGDVELAYWYTNWYGEYTQEFLARQSEWVDRWEILIGADPERPEKFVVWYIGYSNNDCAITPRAKFYVDSLTDIRPTPAEMEKGE